MCGRERQEGGLASGEFVQRRAHEVRVAQSSARSTDQCVELGEARVRVVHLGPVEVLMVGFGLAHTGT